MDTETGSRQYVSRKDSEALLQNLMILPGDAGSGFFGPGTITWQVNRESAVFLGAGRAALLQLAHPWVSAALAHHSNLLQDATGRFHSTFRVIYTMLFGTRAQALAAARQLYRRHTGIRGQLPHAVARYSEGDPYQANEVAALRWVYATLVESAILAYEFVLPPLSPAQREQYYSESKIMAALFGIRSSALPEDWSAFLRYTAGICESPELGVEPGALALSRSVLSGVGTLIRPPYWYHALTAFWMPPRLRDEFALPFGEREQAAVHNAGRWLRRLYPLMPKTLRFVGPFHEAQARLLGRRPGPLIRSNNRFWMGQPRLLYSQLLD